MNNPSSSKRRLLAGAALIAMSGSAAAADIAKAPPLPPAIASSWAGFYFGIHGGYGWMQDNFHQIADNLNTPGQYLNGVRGQGAIYGGQFGYNWQAGRLIAGFETDFSVTNLRGSTTLSDLLVVINASSTAFAGLEERSRYVGTARGRAGWLATDNLMIYGTAGLAWERADLIQHQSNFVQNGGASAFVNLDFRTPFDKFGWVAGLGVEAMLGSPNWIGRLEYLHYDFGSIFSGSTATSVVAGTTNASTGGAQTIDVVRAGISYKLGAPSATSAYAAYGKAPITSSSSSSWAGFYLGGHGGYGWGQQHFSLPLGMFDPNATESLNGIKSSGWSAGAHMGHNWQYDRVVAGIETDLDAARIKGATNPATYAPNGNVVTTTRITRVDYLGTLRGRLGWLATENLLLYGTAGLAWERLSTLGHSNTVAPGGQTAQNDSVRPDDRFGFAVGAGAETRLGNTNWIGRIEYMHYDFGRTMLFDGSLVNSQGGVNINAAITSGRQTIDVVRAGASYRFGNTPSDAMASAAPNAKNGALPASWVGFYTGLHGGYGWKTNDFATAYSGALIGGIHSRGWLVGGHVGHNWQIGKVVAGFELDGSATEISGSSAAVTGGTSTGVFSDNVKYLGTLRARLGWAATETVLLYGTGGLAWERANRDELRISTANPANVTTNVYRHPRDQFGWVAGAGGEMAISADRRWIGRIEYLHYDFGQVEQAGTYISNIPGNPSVIERPGRQTIDTVRAGVSYRLLP